MDLPELGLATGRMKCHACVGDTGEDILLIPHFFHISVTFWCEVVVIEVVESASGTSSGLWGLSEYFQGGPDHPKWPIHVILPATSQSYQSLGQRSLLSGLDCVMNLTGGSYCMSLHVTPLKGSVVQRIYQNMPSRSHEESQVITCIFRILVFLKKQHCGSRLTGIRGPSSPTAAPPAATPHAHPLGSCRPQTHRHPPPPGLRMTPRMTPSEGR